MEEQMRKTGLSRSSAWVSCFSRVSILLDVGEKLARLDRISNLESWFRKPSWLCQECCRRGENPWLECGIVGTEQCEPNPEEYVASISRASTTNHTSCRARSPCLSTGKPGWSDMVAVVVSDCGERSLSLGVCFDLWDVNMLSLYFLGKWHMSHRRNLCCTLYHGMESHL